MNIRSLVNHLEDYLRIEIESKRTAMKWIEAQELAISRNDPEAFEAAVKDARNAFQKNEANAQRRTKLLTALASQWKVHVGTLTLGGIARRLGDEGRNLDNLRLELRQHVAEVIKRNRRLSALIGMHRRINTDMMQVILGSDSPEDVESGGSLINAEA